MQLVRVIGHWGKGREGSQVSGLGNINTIWRYWGRGKLNEENAKSSFEGIVWRYYCYLELRVEFT